MKWIGTKNLGMLLLGIWLTVTGAMTLADISFSRTRVLYWPRSPSRPGF